MSTPLITIPKEEYDNLIKIKEEVVSAFNEGKTILHYHSYFPGHSGYPRHEYSVANAPAIIAGLNKELEEIKDRNNKLEESNIKLQGVYKGWWEYIPKRKWFQLIPMK